MKRIALVICCMIVGFAAMSQNRIPGTPVAFDFPRGGWKYLETIKVDENTNVYLYSFSRNEVIDGEGDTILPNMRIYVRKNYTKGVFDLVMERYMKNPYQSINEYMDNLPAEGIGYNGIYQDRKDGKYYRFDMIYFKDKTTAFEFRLETTSDTYNDFEEEFAQILQTVVVKRD